MKRLIFKWSTIEEYPEDISMIVEMCADLGYYIERDDAEQAWLKYSESVAANWITVPNNKSLNDKWFIFNAIEPYCNKEYF